MIAALVALIGAALVVFLRGKGLFGRDAMSVRLRSAAALWLVALVGAVLAFRQPGFDMAGIGLYRFGWREAGLGLLFGVLGILSVPLYILVARRLGGAAHNAEAITTLASAPLPWRLVLLTTAGVAEEVIFRAVAIGALVAAGVPLAIAVAISLAVFVVLHRSSWGAVHLIFVAVAGALMTAAFVLGGVWAAILAHVIIDAPMFLAGKAMARRGPPAPSQIR
ncbi:CPBP family intramembrane glutamic endopeptidase [Porphyrobacter sp. YT40]|uniref:CPBP family intramembrane glutamic endopeptidase n=1 Tax=Porphyrobacter sp. YT40 TaxID=2547601 RepID=UPI001144CA99|nr:CPBP family intramembrane glutamic endopeptidase [Porphyrobacter sp. YT40]QDH35185.1 CPBP family intramembrane metalloprotease [Porphyrobacter sp. YT40]